MSLARTRSPSQAVLVAPASPSSRQTAGAALLQYLPPAAEALSGPYADLAAEASPPLTTTDDFSVFGPLSFGEEWSTNMEPEQQRCIDILCEGTKCETSADLPTIAIGSAAAASAAAAVRSSVSIQHRAAASVAGLRSEAAAPIEPAAPRRQRQRTSENAAPRRRRQRASAVTPAAPEAQRRQRPSALARQLRSGHKGRPRTGQGMRWSDPAVICRLRQLKQLWRDGALTQPAAAAILRQEFGVARVGHATVCRRFKELP